MQKEHRSVFSAMFIFSAILFGASLFFVLISRTNYVSAYSISSGVSAFFRLSLVPVSNIFDFFIFESIIVFLPFFVFFGVFYIIRSFTRKEAKRRFLNVFSLILMFVSLYFLTIGVGYRSSLETAEIKTDAAECKLILEKLRDEVNELSSEEEFDPAKTAEQLYDAYRNLGSKHLIVSVCAPKPKLMRASALATDMRILASYSFLTSEISLNADAPSYMQVFSISHEMAHLFGISGEGEASFYAYLASLETTDEKIIYSAKLNAFEHVGRELYKMSAVDYFEVYGTLSEKAKRDIESYSEFYSSADSEMADISDKMNNGIVKLWNKKGGYDVFFKFLLLYYKGEIKEI